jgi:hypothetical protein
MKARLFDGPLFYRYPAAADSREVIEWWERRRGFYNQVLISTASLTCLLIAVCAGLSERRLGTAIGLPNPPSFLLLGVLFFIAMANAFYTAGWAVELLMARFLPWADSAYFGVRSFKAGVKMSVAMTLLPAVYSWASFLYYVMSGTRP